MAHYVGLDVSLEEQVSVRLTKMGIRCGKAKLRPALKQLPLLLKAMCPRQLK
jgi:hypothetical protein